jgi:hypothetical protein
MLCRVVNTHKQWTTNDNATLQVNAKYVLEKNILFNKEDVANSLAVKPNDSIPIIPKLNTKCS